MRVTIELLTDPKQIEDSIDRLAGTTSCSLLANLGGYQIEVARGRVFPQQTVLHTVPVLDGHDVVQVDCVHPDFEDHVLPLPPNGETTVLGQAILQRVQWERGYIVVNPAAMDSSSLSASLKLSKPPQPTKMDNNSISAAEKTSKKIVAESGQPIKKDSNSISTAEKSSKIVAESGQPTKKDSNSISTAEKTTKKVVAKSGQPTKRGSNSISAAEKTSKKIVVESGQPTKKDINSISTAEKTTKKVVAESGQTTKKEIAAKKVATNSKVVVASKQKKQPSTIVATEWTTPNSKSKYGQSTLSAAELESAGHACASLHTYYMQGCVAKKQNGIVVKYKRSHFLRSLDSGCFIMGFDDIYDLFNLDALHMSIMRCMTLSMVVETKARTLPMGFLDPEMMSLSTIGTDPTYVVEYVTKAFKHFPKKDYIMFAHNPGGHWILVVVILKLNKVLYLDSERSKQRDHSMLKGVIDDAYSDYCISQRIAYKKLVHSTKFPCHQQPPGNTCGFYTAYHMMIIMGFTNLQDPKEFDVLTSPPVDGDVLNTIRDKIASFMWTR